MNITASDRDLLALEPSLYLDGGFGPDRRITGSDGDLSVTTFNSAASDFSTAGISAGMVLCIWFEAPEEPTALEIVSVDSATSLTVTVPRVSDEDPTIPPPSGTGLGFRVTSYLRQIRQTVEEVSELLSTSAEQLQQRPPAVFDAALLRQAVALGALTRIYEARAEGGDGAGTVTTKAEKYRSLYEQTRARLRVTVDTDGDGFPDETRTLGHISLRRT